MPKTTTPMFAFSAEDYNELQKAVIENEDSNPVFALAIIKVLRKAVPLDVTVTTPDEEGEQPVKAKGPKKV